MDPKSALAATALACTLLLTSCSAPSTPEPSPEVADVATQTPTATPTPTLPSAEVGSTVDEATAEALNKSRGNQRAYPMPDGTFIVISKDAPLPEAVQNEVNAQGTAYTTQFPSDGPGMFQVITDARQAVMGKIYRETGRNPTRISTSSSGATELACRPANPTEKPKTPS